MFMTGSGLIDEQTIRGAQEIGQLQAALCGSVSNSYRNRLYEMHVGSGQVPDRARVAEAKAKRQAEHARQQAAREEGDRKAREAEQKKIQQNHSSRIARKKVEMAKAPKPGTVKELPPRVHKVTEEGEVVMKDGTVGHVDDQSAPSGPSESKESEPPKAEQQAEAATKPRREVPPRDPETGKFLKRPKQEDEPESD